MTAPRRDTPVLDEHIAAIEKVLESANPSIRHEVSEHLRGIRRMVENEFVKWVRGNKNLHSVRDGMSIHDMDLIVHRYKTHYQGRLTRLVQHLMVVEYKQFGATLSDPQRDTLHVLNQLLRNTRSSQYRAQDTKARIVKAYSWKNKIEVCIKCWGVHSLVMPGPAPTGACDMTWDHRARINSWQLEKLLRFEYHPDTLKPMEDRSHHRT